MSWSVQAYRPSSSPPRGTKVVPRIGILPPMVTALPIATFGPALGASCAIVLTRSMRAARRWIRQQRRGTERAGLVASSSARAAQAPRDRHPGEHRPGALVSEPRERHPLVALSRRRSDGVSGAGARARLDDRHVGRRLTLVGRRLELSQFSRGEVDGRKEARPAKDLKNAYRVLLTRARQGLVIFVRPGAKRDRTRSPGFYEGVSEYLTDLGVPQV